MVRTTCSAAIFVIALAHFATAAADDTGTCASDSNNRSAIDACTRLISAGKHNGKDLGRLYYNRGLKWRYNHDFDRAIADFSQTIRLDPNWPWPYVARGHAYASKKDFPRAFADQEVAIRMETTAVTYTGRAIDLIDAGAYDRAIADLNEALRRDGKYFYGYLNRGKAYLKKREFGKAEADYRKALELRPNDQDAKNGLKHARERVVN